MSTVKAKVIVITKNNKKLVTRFRNLPDAKVFRDKIKEMKHSHVDKVCLVSTKIKYPDAETKAERGKLWCPYCGKHRAFKKGYRGDDYRWCEICGISNGDYHVKAINKLDSAEGVSAYAAPPPRSVLKVNVREKLVVHNKVICQGKGCLPDKVRLQWMSTDERKKRKGNVLIYCPKCSTKSSADAKELHRWLSKN